MDWSLRTPWGRLPGGKWAVTGLVLLGVVTLLLLSLVSYTMVELARFERAETRRGTFIYAAGHDHDLQVLQEERAQLDTGWNYLSDLIGCTIFDEDRELGKIDEVRLHAGEAPVLVVKAESKEYEIPYAEAYVREVDVSHRQIRMSLPEGLLEINAPLTAEEKLAQRKATRKGKK